LFYDISKVGEKMEKEYEILTLDDNKDYANMQELTYEGETYAFLLEVDKEDNPTEEFLILKKIMINDTEYEFEEVPDGKMDDLLDLFEKEFTKEA